MLRLFYEEISVNHVNHHNQKQNYLYFNFFIGGVFNLKQIYVFVDTKFFVFVNFKSEILNNVEVDDVTYFINNMSCHEDSHNLLPAFTIEILSDDFSVSCHEEVFVLVFYQFLQKDKTSIVSDYPVSADRDDLDGVGKMLSGPLSFLNAF